MGGRELSICAGWLAGGGYSSGAGWMMYCLLKAAFPLALRASDSAIWPSVGVITRDFGGKLLLSLCLW